MKEQNSDLLTAGNIAQKLSMPGTKVKQAIKDLGIKPAAKKGICSYYSSDVIAKIKSKLK